MLCNVFEITEKKITPYFKEVYICIPFLIITVWFQIPFFFFYLSVIFGDPNDNNSIQNKKQIEFFKKYSILTTYLNTTQHWISFNTILNVFKFFSL